MSCFDQKTLYSIDSNFIFYMKMRIPHYPFTFEERNFLSDTWELKRFCFTSATAPLDFSLSDHKSQEMHFGQAEIVIYQCTVARGILQLFFTNHEKV